MIPRILDTKAILEMTLGQLRNSLQTLALGQLHVCNVPVQISVPDQL